MAVRPTWKGTLKLSLITVPVRVYHATTPAGDVRFRQLHERCGTPIQLRKWCPHCKEEVSADDLAKGFELTRGSFVLLEPQDIKAVRPQSTHTLEISKVVDASSIDPIYVDEPFYMIPDEERAASAFAVLREGLDGKAAIGTIVLHTREHVVALVPRGQALVMLTLRRADEVRALDDIDAEGPATGRTTAAELKLAKNVLATFEGELELEDYPDEYEAALRKMIKAKAAGKEIVEPEIEKPAKVVNLMDALRKSLAEVKTPQRRSAARPKAGRRARVVPHKPRRRTA